MINNNIRTDHSHCVSIIITLLILLTSLIAPVAWADSCTFAPGAVNLPDSSSVAANTTVVNAQGNTAMACAGLGVSLLSSYSLSAKIASTSNNLNLKNAAGDLIPYSIYRTGSFNPALGINGVLDYSSANLLVVGLTGITANLPIYIRTGNNGAINVNISAGTYTDVINLAWSYNICKVAALGACIGGYWTGTGTGPDVSSITVTLVVSKNCAINIANDVNFGGFALVGQFNPISQTITLTCTKGSTFNTYVIPGNTAQNNWQRMKQVTTSSTPDYLQYQLYQGVSGTTLWNASSMQTGAGTGTQQQVPFRAVINPNQIQRTPGDYQDDVSLVLMY
ncbi:spore coat protein U domain-containing protein [Yersinia sp. KBS0713]|uniref:Csu type fimbrial protein n=1 Tax=Yersinia TaxID=629 RepID=UPI00110E581D|nr:MULTISPECIES: spore coat U domain-containing protein [Yersinia]QDW33607.1 spore coat protein U domain-containing protein [Yersinia sp. KBS0713]